MRKLLISWGLIFLLFSVLWAQAVDEYIWVTNLVSNTVTRIKKTDSTTTTIAVGDGPGAVAVDETYVWVTNVSSNNVTRIKKADLSTTMIAVGKSPRGMAVDDTYVWVVNFDNVTRIKKTDLSTTTIAIGRETHGVTVDETYVWVANMDNNNVTRIKKSDLTTTQIDVGTRPMAVAVDETYVWVTNEDSNNVTRIKKADLSMATIAVGKSPNQVAVDETYVWVGNYDSRNVTRIKKADLTTTKIAVGRGWQPTGVAVDETYVWVAISESHNVTRIKKADLSITTIDAGKYPNSSGDMTGYAYSFFWGNRVRLIEPEAFELKPEDNLTQIIENCLNNLRDSAQRRKAEAILVGLKERSLGPLVNTLEGEFKKEEESDQTLVKEIKELIPQLGAKEWTERDKAQKRLEAMGTKAIPFLKEATQKAPDPEIRMRAKLALDQIEGQGYSEVERQRRGFISSILNIMGNIESLKQPELASFVRTLRDSDFFLRRLAYEWLKRLTGKELPFEPEKSPTEEASHIKAWESLIEKEFSK